MTVQHSLLPNSELHEPKDVSSAAIGQVYVADGSGGGDWDILTSNQVVYVNAKGDFPAPSAGAITLAAQTTYVISGDINIGSDRLILSADNGIVGNNRFTDNLIYTGTGNMITATTTHVLRELGITAATGTILSLTGSGVEALVYTNVFVTTCLKVGTIASWANVSLRSFSVIGATDVTNGGLLFTGTGSGFNISDSLWRGVTNGTQIDFGSATFDRIQIETGNRFDVASGVTAISGLTSSGNLNTGGSGIITGTIFQGAGTALNNISPADLQWDMENNKGIADSTTIGGLQKDTGRTTTTLIDSTAVKVAGASTLATNSERFDDDSGANNTLRHLGIDTVKVMAMGTIVARSAGGSTVTCDIVAKTTGGDLTVVNGVDFPTASSADVSFSFSIPTSMAENDTIELFVTRTSGTQDLDVAFYQTSAHGV